MSDIPKVLIADDEQECIDFVRETLSDTPYEILTAADGEEALKVVREQSPDLIILDVQMPKRNGIEVFGDLKKDASLSGIPVIMLTGIAERTGFKFSENEMGEYYGSEPDAYVDKPIEPVVLKQTVSRLIKGARAGT